MVAFISCVADGGVMGHITWVRGSMLLESKMIVSKSTYKVMSFFTKQLTFSPAFLLIITIHSFYELFGGCSSYCH